MKNLHYFISKLSNSVVKSINAFTALILISLSLTVGSVANANEQILYVSGEPVAAYGDGNELTISYDATNPNTVGLGLRVHYDSSKITITEFNDFFTQDSISGPSLDPIADNFDYDNNDETDAYFVANWASLFAGWPGSVPANLVTIKFTVQTPNSTVLENDQTPINFSYTSKASGYQFVAQNYVLPITNDSDGDGCPDTEDLFPYDASECYDNDGDGIGDNADPNDDNDPLNDDEDAFPFDPTEWEDTDLDGIGNNADDDDDNDGVPDVEDRDPKDPTIGRHTQTISVTGEPIAVIGSTTLVDIAYSTSDGNNQLPGLGFRIHYNSQYLSFNQNIINIDDDIVVNEGPFDDDQDYDNNTATDKFLTLAWASVNGNWPQIELPATLLSVKFNVLEVTESDTLASTRVSFSGISVSSGYDFEAINYDMDVLAATWDFDNNGQVDALTDGLVLLRYTFGLRGETLSKGAIAADSSFTSSQIEEEVIKALIIADIDKNGEVDALTDGLVLLRYLFGLRGDALIAGVISYGAERTTVQDIESYIIKFLP